MTTAELQKRVMAYFAQPEYVVIREVANVTGAAYSRRYADGIAMSVWPSRGLELHGLETKVSRSDWTKELHNPAKAEAVYQFCDRWWLVVGDESIVKDGELPPTWGLLVPYRESLKAKVSAPKLEATPITRAFLASLLRKSVEQSVDTAELTAAKAQAREEGVKVGEAIANRQLKDLRDLAAKVAEFENASGVNIRYGWQGAKKIGEAVRRVLDGEMPLDALKKVRNWIERTARSFDECIAEMEQQPTSQERQSA